MYRIALGKKQMVTEIIKLWIIISNLVIDIEKKMFPRVVLKRGRCSFSKSENQICLEDKFTKFWWFSKQTRPPDF